MFGSIDYWNICNIMKKRTIYSDPKLTVNVSLCTQDSHISSILLCQVVKGVYLSQYTVNNICCFHMLYDSTTIPNRIGISVCMTFCSLCWWCTNTLHLSLPAGWEGWGLHQPPRVQNRPSHRVQKEIVSVPHMPPELLIKHICSHPHNTNAYKPTAHRRKH